ncbi:hypothetical protein [Nostoc sp.]
MGHGEEVTNALFGQCPKGWGDYPSPPTLGLEFPAAFNELCLPKTLGNAKLISPDVY